MGVSLGGGGAGLAARGVVVLPFSIVGALTVRVGTQRFYLPTGGAIQSVRASLGTSPSNQAVILDVNKNGSTIFTTQASRPTIAKDGVVSGSVVPDVAAVLAGDYLTVDLDQVGSEPQGRVDYVGTDAGATSFGVTSYNVTRPSTSQIGDLTLLFLRGRDAGNDWTPPVDSGWTQLHEVTYTAGTTKVYVFYRLDDGQPGPWTFTSPAASSVISARVWYRNVHPTNPIDTSAAANGQTGGALTTTNTNTQVVIAGTLDNARVATPPAGYTARTAFDGVTSAFFHVADLLVADAGAVAAATFTETPSTTATITAHIAIRPAPLPEVWSPGRDLTLVVRYIET